MQEKRHLLAPWFSNAQLSKMRLDFTDQGIERFEHRHILSHTQLLAGQVLTSATSHGLPERKPCPRGLQVMPLQYALQTVACLDELLHEPFAMGD